MEFKQYDGYEVDARNVRVVVDAFRLFPDVGLKPFTKRGVGIAEQAVAPGFAWHPLAAWLAAIHEIVRTVGPNKAYEVGKQIPRVAVFPPGIHDAHSAMRLVDVAYHMNHRKNGRLMFNEASGEMLEGIGHYHYEANPNQRRIVMECDNPFPCDFDRGIVVALVARFEKNAVIQHLDEAGCRKRGHDGCRYLITW
jgi:hypothetical protein